MLKAKTLQAVSIDLADNVEAVFVAQGDPWNGLQEWRCIAPGAFAGDLIITAPAVSDEGPMASMFSEIFGRLKDRPIVMASPRLAAVIQAIKTDPTSSRVS